MRRIRRNFKRPLRPWDSERIKEQRDLMNKYGLPRNMEVLKMESKLRTYRQRARKLIGIKNEVETKLLLDKLVKIGLIQKGQGLDEVLALKVVSILERRLQTIVFRKGLAKTALHARQKIVHRHVQIGDRRINIPSYIVPVSEEGEIKLIAGDKPEPVKPVHKAEKAEAAEAVAEEAEKTEKAQEAKNG